LIYSLNFLLAGVLVVVCIWTDLKTRTIYNRYTYPAVIIGLILCIATAQYSNIYGSLIIMAVYLFFFLTGKMGGGDLKLAVALSLFLGAEPVLLGSILAAVIMIAWGFVSTWHKTGQIRNGLLVAAGKLPGGEVPYGAMLGPASIIVYMFKILTLS